MPVPSGFTHPLTPSTINPMNTRIKPRTLRSAPAAALAALVLTLGALPAATAQVQTNAIKPPVPRRADKVPIASYIAVLLVIAAPLAVNFVSSKRGHQD